MPDALAPDDAAGLRSANARLRELLAERDAMLGELRGHLEALRAEAEGLRSQVADLAARVAANSQNSSKPPSSDGLAKPAPRSLRKKSGCGPGRPKGQPGTTMQLTDAPDRRVRHAPARCRCCGEPLGGARETGVERRQVIEIPPVRAEVTEHQAVELECGGCGERTRGEFPDGVAAPVQYGPRAAAIGVYLWHGQFLSRDRACQALGELFSCAPSPGALQSMARKAAGLVAPAVRTITAALVKAEVAHFDESGFRVAGKLSWVHSASSGRWVLVSVHPREARASGALAPAGPADNSSPSSPAQGLFR